jgi:hypothetical protein
VKTVNVAVVCSTNLHADAYMGVIIIDFISVSNEWTTYIYMESSMLVFITEQDIPEKTAGKEEEIESSTSKEGYSL